MDRREGKWMEEKKKMDGKQKKIIYKNEGCYKRSQEGNVNEQEERKSKEEYTRMNRSY